MTLIHSQEELRELGEAELTKGVLIPLFKSLGYHEVRDYSGGPLEQGKDLVMWKEDEFGTRRNYAVVAKAGKISGKASRLAQTVLTQVLQALGSTFLDELTRDEHSVDRVLVVNSHAIKTEALQSLRTSLKGSQVGDRVEFIPGDRLWELARQHLPRQLVFSNLAEARRALNDADSDYSYLVALGPENTQLILVPKSPQTPSIEVSFDPSFPDTEEGREQRRAFERFLATREPATISSEYLKVSGLPVSAKLLMEGLGAGTIHLGPSLIADPVRLALNIKREGNPEVPIMPYLEFKAVKGDREGVVISNAEQGIPFKFELSLGTDDGKGNFQYDFSGAAKNAHLYFQALSIQQQLARGGTLFLEDLERGFHFPLFQLDPGYVPEPGDEFVDLWRRVRDVQRKTQVEISRPARPHFTNDDIAALTAIEGILETGEGSPGHLRVKIKIPVSAARNLIEKHPEGELGACRLEFPEHSERFLETSIPLGPVCACFSSATIPAEAVQEMRNRLDGESVDTDLSVEVIIEAKGSDSELQFLKWAKDP